MTDGPERSTSSAARGTDARSEDARAPSPPATRRRWCVAPARLAVGALIALAVLRACVVQFPAVSSASMAPTLLVGDRVVVNRLAYGLPIPFTSVRLWASLPDRGDVVVFEDPTRPGGELAVKRVLGLPNDVVEIRERRVLINGVPLADDRIFPEQHLDTEGALGAHTSPDLFGSIRLTEEVLGSHRYRIANATRRAPSAALEGRWQVAAGQLFVVGDNRDDSRDSRAPAGAAGLGPVPVERLVGRVDGVLFSRGTQGG